MPGEFKVTPEDLRAAYEALRSLGRLDVDVALETSAMHAVVLPDASGMLQAVAEKAANFEREIRALVTALAGGLAAAAKAYDVADLSVEHEFSGATR